MTDLEQMRDHPSRVLDNYAKEALEESNRIKGLYSASHAEALQALGDGLLSAATELRIYERLNDVSFAALDRETFEHLKHSFDRLDGGGSGNRELIMQDIVDDVRSLFGFE